MENRRVVAPVLLSIILAVVLLPAPASTQALACLTQWGSVGGGDGHFHLL
jgi:hypothetical protein